ncbi:MAG: bifunctional phosphoribosylaminoimidazolecarboxamide formyltransferase/IMP cyclohydrolase PurH [Proteobacteria bacterium]|nr:bifunctional phosphoribosylaminoimidazolecarboxamide formyltransferase/IMP cyclohydrolase PurH [Pseudomonadota bacterium]NCA28186.1 bifunctional phosphoribosylaminoimidazolecarboxamide formyltransferase/IMP cyclohydrolase PurH [Pseudomonadota bacterium]
MQNLQKISRCLISVSDKSGIIELAKFLVDKGVEIISTGGTFKLLQQNKIPALDISEFTGFPEIMDGRVKTLHPKVHGGLLGILDNEIHNNQASQNNIQSIDLLIINLYPFVETLAKTNDSSEIIENIDIGGPAMVRSAGKNFAFKTVICSSDNYSKLIVEMEKNNNHTSLEFRQKMASYAFKNIAEYDLAISNWFNKDNFALLGELKQKLRYGENSHQLAEVYSYQNISDGVVNALQIQGKELSYNNFNDADSAFNLVLEFSQPTCAIIKHANPCGVASSDNILDSYKKALASDAKSAFGGIVAVNQEIDENLAQELSKIFYEVIIAPSITDKAQEILANKKNLRILIAKLQKNSQRQIKSIAGGFLVQDFDNLEIKIDDLKLVTEKSLNNSEIEQLVFAMKVCKHVKSNAIVVVKNMQTFGLGVGQTSRVDSCEIACHKASKYFDGEKFIDMARGSFMASDAFFPFADNIEIAHKYGIKGIVAPAGSMRDAEVIAKAEELGVALYFITSRHFKH